MSDRAEMLPSHYPDRTTCCYCGHNWPHPSSCPDDVEECRKILRERVESLTRERDAIEAESNSQQTTLLNQAVAIDRLITERDAAEQRATEAERQAFEARHAADVLLTASEGWQRRAEQRGKLLERWLTMKGIEWSEKFKLVQETREELGK